MFTCSAYQKYEKLQKVRFVVIFILPDGRHLSQFSEVCKRITLVLWIRINLRACVRARVSS